MGTETFKNHFLIAMPTLNDPYYHQTVILLFEHTDEGAMGLIINKPLEISVGEILQHLNIPITNSDFDKAKVMLGGPVASEQGFIIHTHPELCPGDVIDKDRNLTVSASKEVLLSIAEKQFDNIILCLGYSAWKKGQLEQEIIDNAWMLAKVDFNVLFSLPHEKQWKESGKLLGVDFDRLSTDVGHG